MDSRRFDNLTRGLATPFSRRRMLGGVVASLIGLATRGAMAQAARNRPAGALCGRATECASRFCVDGVCCLTPCTGQCEACNLPGQVGTCQAVSGAPVGRHAACPGQGVCAAACDGTTRDRCAFPDDDVVCGASACVDGWQTTYACGGNGTCVPTTVACGDYEICRDGVCVACPAGTAACGGTCVACSGNQQPNPVTCACECPPGTEPVADDAGSICRPVCSGGTTRCGEGCLPFCEFNTPHAAGCAECVCPAGSLTCTLPTGYDRPHTCCAADQECCRVGPVDDPSTIVVCCPPGSCVPGTGCR